MPAEKFRPQTKDDWDRAGALVWALTELMLGGSLYNIDALI